MEGVKSGHGWGPKRCLAGARRTNAPPTAGRTEEIKQQPEKSHVCRGAIQPFNVHARVLTKECSLNLGIARVGLDIPPAQLCPNCELSPMLGHVDIARCCLANAHALASVEEKGESKKVLSIEYIVLIYKSHTVAGDTFSWRHRSNSDVSLAVSR